MRKIILAFLSLAVSVAIAFADESSLPALSKSLPLEFIQLPPGFKIEIYAENVPNARSMTVSPSGTLYVGTRVASGNVYAIPDRDKDNKGDKVIFLAGGLRVPNGVAFKDGALYIAEIYRVIRFDDIENHLNDPPKPVVINESFSKEGHHGWKFMAFGPDGLLYIPVGMPCNVCERDDDPRFGSILRMNPDGSDLKLFANGIRNTVGFDWHPATRELWFTDNGRDMMGDDLPPDELNYAPKSGMNFGFPYCHGKEISDPEFGAKLPCSDFVPAAVELGPHVAALGMRFYTGKMFPQEYQNQIFIAEHGSWNRSKKIGYRVMRVTLEGNTPTGYEVFAEGWKQGEKVWGRPVDVLVMPDGALLVSDDHAGAIYRITYTK